MDHGDKAEVWMSDFSIAMLKALNACESLVQNVCKEVTDVPVPDDRSRGSNVDLMQTSFHGRSSIDIVEFFPRQEVSAADFLFPYIEGNVPCIIRGMDNCFDKATQLWTQADEKGAGRVIDRSWFLENVQEKVPVRMPLAVDKPRDLDSDGRATECETQFMTIEEWVSYLDTTQPAAESCKDQLYLKDWHFQLWLEQQDPQHSELYKVPPIFPRDLLNGFLNEFGIGDYRFVYWGPRGSSTSIHSDVMNSFSWSYNVVGTKLWTFFPENDDLETATIRQEQGELMFVPSGLKHSVINQEETISINHNWVPSTIVRRVWDCLEQENRAVDRELASWGSMVNHSDAQESMLRGCLGLNVTSYFFMILLEGLRLIYAEKVFVCDYIALRKLGRMMDIVLEGGTEKTIDVRARLSSQLGSDGKVESATRLALLLVSVANKKIVDG